MPVTRLAHTVWLDDIDFMLLGRTDSISMLLDIPFLSVLQRLWLIVFYAWRSGSVGVTRDGIVAGWPWCAAAKTPVLGA